MIRLERGRRWPARRPTPGGVVWLPRCSYLHRAWPKQPCLPAGCCAVSEPGLSGALDGTIPSLPDAGPLSWPTTTATPGVIWARSRARSAGRRGLMAGDRDPRRVLHRVSRRGNRKINHALHMAAITQIRNPGTAEAGVLTYDDHPASRQSEIVSVPPPTQQIWYQLGAQPLLGSPVSGEHPALGP